MYNIRSRIVYSNTLAHREVPVKDRCITLLQLARCIDYLVHGVAEAVHLRPFRLMLHPGLVEGQGGVAGTPGARWLRGCGIPLVPPAGFPMAECMVIAALVICGSTLLVVPVVVRPAAPAGSSLPLSATVLLSPGSAARLRGRLCAQLGRSGAPAVIVIAVGNGAAELEQGCQQVWHIHREVLAGHLPLQEARVVAGVIAVQQPRWMLRGGVRLVGRVPCHAPPAVAAALCAAACPAIPQPLILAEALTLGQSIVWLQDPLLFISRDYTKTICKSRETDDGGEYLARMSRGGVPVIIAILAVVPAAVERFGKGRG